MNLWYKFLDKIIGEYVNEEINDFYIQIQKAKEWNEILKKRSTEEKTMEQNQNKMKKKKEKI